MNKLNAALFCVVCFTRDHCFVFGVVSQILLSRMAGGNLHNPPPIHSNPKKFSHRIVNV
jgi:hypothetical protein